MTKINIEATYPHIKTATVDILEGRTHDDITNLNLDWDRLVITYKGGMTQVHPRVKFESEGEHRFPDSICIDDEITYHMFGPEIKEKRVYLVGEEAYMDGTNLNDEEFIELAEEYGTVWSLEGFAKAVNKGEINLQFSKMRVV